MSKLGGHLVGYGIETNGKVEYHWLDKPKHNMIVKSGLEHLLQFGGDPVATYGPLQDNLNATDDALANESLKTNLWVGKIDEPRVHHGVLNYCSYGSGDKDTEFTDTNLQNPILSEPIETRYVSYGCNGNKFVYDSSNNITGIKYRISHHFPKVTDKTIIKELGWFGKAGENKETAQYVLFARIKLDEELVLQPDQSLIVTYELTETFVEGTYAAGMLGNTATRTIYPLFYSNVDNNRWDQIINRNSISETGNPAKYTRTIDGVNPGSVLSFPAWYIAPPILKAFDNTGSWSTSNFKHLNYNMSGWYKKNFNSRYKLTVIKYKENSFERFAYPNYITTIEDGYSWPNHVLLEYGTLYYNVQTIQWMYGAKKISYTTDVME